MIGGRKNEKRKENESTRTLGNVVQQAGGKRTQDKTAAKSGPLNFEGIGEIEKGAIEEEDRMKAKSERLGETLKERGEEGITRGGKTP